MTVAAEVTPPALPALFDVESLASQFGVSPATVRRWVRDGSIPSPVKVGGRSVWTVTTINAFLNGEPPARAED